MSVSPDRPVHAGTPRQGCTLGYAITELLHITGQLVIAITELLPVTGLMVVAIPELRRPGSSWPPHRMP